MTRRRHLSVLFSQSTCLDLVGAWLAHYGIPSSSISTTHGRAGLTVRDVLVSQADQLLGASYQLYRNTNTNGTIIRTLGYSVPVVLHTLIQAVTPTTDFASIGVMRQAPRRRSFETTQAEAASERLVTTRWSFMVTPEYLQYLYKTSGYVPVADGRNKLGVVGFLNQFASEADLATFMALFRTDGVRRATFAVEQLTGGWFDMDLPSGQANIGIQYAGGMAYPNPVTFYAPVTGLETRPSRFLNSWPASRTSISRLPSVYHTTEVTNWNFC